MIEELIQSIDNCLLFSNKIKKSKENLIIQKEKIRLHLKKLDNIVKEYVKAYEYYKQGVDVVYEKTVKSLEKQLTNLLQEVFLGCNYGVSFEIEDLRNVKNLIIEFVDDNHKGDPKDFGGSLRTVVGYLFHMMYLIKSGRPRILLMDECFKDVNSDYLFNLIDLIHNLTKSTDSINVLISHTEELQQITNKVYTVQNGEYYESKVG